MDGSRPNKQPQQQTFDLDSATEEIARSYGVPSAVWRRMVGQESGGNEKAVSPKGARTAWQIMDATARGLGYTPEEIRAEPLKAAEGGLRILRDNYRRFRPNAENEKHAWMMSVAGYHTNPNNVARDLKKGGLGLPMTSDGLITTRDHVLKIFDGIRGEDLQSAPGQVKRNAPRVPRVSARPLEIEEVPADLQQPRPDGIVNQLPDAEARIGTIRAPQKEPTKFLQSVDAPESFPLVENTKDADSEFIQNGRPVQLPSIVGGKVVPLKPKREPQVSISFGDFNVEEPAQIKQPTAQQPTIARRDLQNAGYIQQPLIDIRGITRDNLEEHLFRESLRKIAPGFGFSDAEIEAEISDRKAKGKGLIDSAGIDAALADAQNVKENRIPVSVDGGTISNIFARRKANEEVAAREKLIEQEKNQTWGETVGDVASQVAGKVVGVAQNPVGALYQGGKDLLSGNFAPDIASTPEERAREAIEQSGSASEELARRERVAGMSNFEYGAAQTGYAVNALAQPLPTIPQAFGAMQRALMDTSLYKPLAGEDEQKRLERVRAATANDETSLQQFGSALRQWVDENLPTNKDVKNDFVTKLSSGVGSLASFMLLGGMSAGIGVSSRLSSGVFGSLMEVGQNYDQFTKGGLSNREASFWAQAGIPVGASEAFGIGRQLDKLTAGKFSREFSRFLIETGNEATEEALQEFFQGTSGKLISAAALSKDKTFAGRLESVYNNLPEALKQGREGALIGAILGGGSRAFLQVPNVLANRGASNENTAPKTGLLANKETEQTSAIESETTPETGLLSNDNQISEVSPEITPSEPVFEGTKGAFSLSEAADALTRQRETNPNSGVKFLQDEFGLDSATAKDVLNQIETETPKARYFTPEEPAPATPAPGTARIEFKDGQVLDISERELRARGIETDEQIQEFIADPENVNELLSQHQTEQTEQSLKKTVRPEKAPLEFNRIRDAYDHFKEKDLIDEKATSEGLQKEQPEIVLSDGRRFALENKDEYLSGLNTKARFVETASPTPTESFAELPGQTEAVKNIRTSAPELVTDADSINLVQDGKTLRSFPNTPKGKIRAERQLEQARIAFDSPQNDADIRFLAKGDAEAFAGNRNAQTAAKEQITAILNQSGLTRLSPVRVVQSENDLPAPVRERIEADNAAGQITGVFHGEDLYLVADNLKNSKPEEILKTAAHEIVGHKGLRALLNDKLNPTLDRIAKDFADDAQFKIIAEGYGLDLSTPEGRREAAEELIAHRSEDAAFRDTSHYQRLRAIVRNALREISAKAFGNPDAIKWTDAEIDALIGRARRRLEKNAAATTQNDIRFSRSAETEPEADILRDISKDRDSYLQTVTNLRRAGLVSSVRTHLRNVSGNTAFQASEEAVRGFAYFADRMIAPLTGERTVSFIDAASVAKSFSAVFKSDGRLNSANSTESGIKQAFNILRHGDSAANLAKAQLSEPTSGNAVIDSWVKLNFRTLGAEDALFKVYGFRRSIEEQAKTLSATAARKDKSINRGAERRKLLDNPSPEMIAQAALDADFLTFQNNNAVSREIQKFKDVNEYGRFLIEQVAPFDKTPTNIVLRALDYTPAGLVRAFGSNLPNVVEGARATELGRETARERFAPVTEKQQKRDERFKELLNRRRRREDAELQQETETVFKKLERNADALDRLLNKPNLTKTEEALRVQIENKIEDLQQQYVDLQQKQTIRQRQREFNDLTITDKQKLVDETLLRFFTRQEQREFSMNIGRATLGTGLMALGYALAANGYLAGIWDYEEKREKGKKRPDDRAAKSRRDEFFWRKEHGIENGSLLIPKFGRVVILDSPGGKILTLGATLFEQSQHRALYAPKGKESYFDSLSLAGKTAKTLATEQPLLRAADSYLDSESKTWEEWTENQAGSYLGSFVPSIAADVGEVLDDRPRKSSGFKNAALRRIPVIREKAEESKLKVPTAERGGTMRKILRAIDPFNTRQVEMKPYIYGTPKKRLPEDVRDALEQDRREQ
ncbi:MAG TPA: transglycosylase SLT domain-containing protein [Pyrinomonadaceae bacterium]|jgi:hypothetical protein